MWASLNVANFVFGMNVTYFGHIFETYVCIFKFLKMCQNVLSLCQFACTDYTTYVQKIYLDDTFIFQYRDITFINIMCIHVSICSLKCNSSRQMLLPS